MYRIIEGRSTGKTGRLMLLAKETGAKIACSNPKAMQEKAYAYGITGIEFIPYSQLFTGKHIHDKILIDEIEAFVSNYADGQLIGYTLTDED